MNNTHTIVAIATPAGEGGIAVIRISGTRAVKAANTILTYKGDLVSHMAKLCEVDTGKIKDEALAIYFKKPHSFTGEDVVEIHCHGNYLIATHIVAALVQKGCRPAEPGEFTRRAFYSGRIDLTRAEGVLDLIKAKSESAINLAYGQLKGGLANKILPIQEVLVQAIARLSAAIDYPEDDIVESAKDEIVAQLTPLRADLAHILDSYQEGVVRREGVRVAIVGSPNVGKSMLLNQLLGFERAIVSDIAGTTRDTLAENFSYQGILFCLIDTAGIRKTTHAIEKKGIARSQEALDSADLILAVYDQTADFTLPLPPHKPIIYVKNKIDLEKVVKNTAQPIDKSHKICYISSLTGKNIDKLKEAMHKEVLGNISSHGALINSMRHLNAVRGAQTALTRALAQSAALSMDCMLSDIQDALRHIASITGTIATEEVVNEIFNKFCVGK